MNLRESAPQLFTSREADTRIPEQKATLLKVLKALKAKYPDAKILDHCV